MGDSKKGIIVSRIVINIKGKELSLSPEEARELRDILDKTVGSRVVKEYVPWPTKWEPWEPYKPYITWTASTSSNPGATATIYYSYS